MAPPKLVICPHCDTVYQRTSLPLGGTAKCGQCGASLYSNRRFGVDGMLALTLAALIALIVANSYPVMLMEYRGVANEATLWQAVLASFDAGVGPIALIAATTVFFFPLIQITLYAYVLLPLRQGRVPRHFKTAMHALRQMKPWSMVEVFLLGALVAVVKLGALATVEPEIGLWGFAGLTLMLTALSSFDLRELWERAEDMGL